jgi:hypothetical protein
VIINYRQKGRLGARNAVLTRVAGKYEIFEAHNVLVWMFLPRDRHLVRER